MRRRLRSWKFARPLINPREVSCLSTSAAYTWPCSRQLPWRCTASFGDRHHGRPFRHRCSSRIVCRSNDEVKPPTRPFLAQPSLRCVTYRAIVLVVVVVVEGYPPPPPPIFPPFFLLSSFRHHFLHFLASREFIGIIRLLITPRSSCRCTMVIPDQASFFARFSWSFRRTNSGDYEFWGGFFDGDFFPSVIRSLWKKQVEEERGYDLESWIEMMIIEILTKVALFPCSFFYRFCLLILFSIPNNWVTVKF